MLNIYFRHRARVCSRASSYIDTVFTVYSVQTVQDCTAEEQRCQSAEAHVLVPAPVKRQAAGVVISE